MDGIRSPYVETPHKEVIEALRKVCRKLALLKVMFSKRYSFSDIFENKNWA
jgi:hypothetical protein